MGLLYLSTYIWLVTVGKYTVRPMDCLGWRRRWSQGQPTRLDGAKTRDRLDNGISTDQRTNLNLNYLPTSTGYIAGFFFPINSMVQRVCCFSCQPSQHVTTTTFRKLAGQRLKRLSAEVYVGEGARLDGLFYFCCCCCCCCCCCWGLKAEGFLRKANG